MTATSGVRRNGGEPRSSSLRYIVWRTAEAIAVPGGVVQVSGDAWPQVRSPERLAAVGDLAAQISHIQAAIVAALADALGGMELTVQELDARHDEITSVTLVTANSKLAAAGVVLLDLAITALSVSPSP